MTNNPAVRGVRLTGHGDMDKMEIRKDLPIPIPGSNDVLVRAAAAGVNNTDINTRMDWYSKKDSAGEDAGWPGQAINFPLIQGADVCGHIIAVGSAIGSNRIGERVLIGRCIREANGIILDQPWYFGSECDDCFGITNTFFGCDIICVCLVQQC